MICTLLQNLELWANQISQMHRCRWLKQIFYWYTCHKHLLQITYQHVFPPITLYKVDPVNISINLTKHFLSLNTILNVHNLLFSSCPYMIFNVRLILHPNFYLFVPISKYLFYDSIFLFVWTRINHFNCFKFQIWICRGLQLK